MQHLEHKKRHIYVGLALHSPEQKITS